jgi:hypothetical protein
MLGLMRYWLFGTFVIVFSAVTIFAGGPLGLGLSVFSISAFWLAMAIVAVLCVVWYYIYKGYLGKN